MQNSRVTKITKEEIALERGTSLPANQSQPSSDVFVADNFDHSGIFSSNYIKKLKDADIEKFFEKFGFVSLERTPAESPTTISVVCEDFFVQFSDFLRAFVFNENYKDSSGSAKFDMKAFLQYCELSDQSPDQVISQLMDVELFGQRFHSFSENRRRAKTRQNKVAFGSLPRDMQKTLRLADENNRNRIDATHNKLKYGDYAGNPYDVM